MVRNLKFVSALVRSTEMELENSVRIYHFLVIYSAIALVLDSSYKRSLLFGVPT